MTENLSKFLGLDLIKLYNDGELLMASASGGFSDYSFVVFPYAKLYEGFLKKLFLETGAITEQQYNNERWRVGKALNPQLEKELRHEESVYDRLIDNCGGDTTIADKLWKAWKEGRNAIFHLYPNHYQPLTLPDAKVIIEELKNAMEAALSGCNIKI